ncbi:DUF6138 family protein [Cronobacter muytjensii]|uniref:DUF6138 family protein n=1 Tax=Cronobacter muytjensii TaxID=413501 RepID=UPI002A128C82|nr:DUF6138 family protein [Cronobacter muytjensii]ELY6274168.1 hypothetical protein [Cronobacter muytjensii]MEB8638759.1 DUF6138 family protein [Cronobacter muytjensii]
MSVFAPLRAPQALALINRWFDDTTERFTSPDAPPDHPLRAGDYSLMLNVESRRVTLEERDEGEADDDPAGWHGALSPDEVRADWLAPLTALIGARLDMLRRETPFRYCRFHIEARFATSEGLLQTTLFEHRDTQYIDELRQAMQAYQRDVLEKGDAPTDPTSTLFYCGNALNHDLFPQPDLPTLLRDCERIQQLNKGSAALAEHRHWIAYLLSDYVERECLPRWFTVQENAWRERQYERRPDTPPPAADESELLLYTAVIILRFEPSYSKSKGLQLLTLAQQLGIKKAAAYLKTGTGVLAQDVATFESEQVKCAANDVIAQVTVQIREETAAAYEQALAFLCRLLAHEFPRSYALKLKSGAKHGLPVKGLARNDTHRFFANALTFERLHPALERYARAAMRQYEWYSDAQAEKCCMPGSYAVFGLALASEAYFPLLADYMALVDDEHQSVQDGFINAFVARYALNARTAPALVACLRVATDALKLKLPLTDDAGTLRALAMAFRDLSPDEACAVLFRLWGKPERLAKRVAKTSGETDARWQALLEAAGLSQA